MLVAVMLKLLSHKSQIYVAHQLQNILSKLNHEIACNVGIFTQTFPNPYLRNTHTYLSTYVLACITTEEKKIEELHGHADHMEVLTAKEAATKPPKPVPKQFEQVRRKKELQRSQDEFAKQVPCFELQLY